MTMNDDFLYKLRKEPRPEFAAALNQRINKPMQIQSKYPARRFTALALSLVAVFTALVLFSPSARAFAEGVIRQIDGYMFTSGTVDSANKILMPFRVSGRTIQFQSRRKETYQPPQMQPRQATWLALKY
jgi:hypothetical protein